MKIKNGKIEDYESKDEVVVRSHLSLALGSWFGLDLTDIPEIMQKIGVRSKNYEIALVDKETYADKVTILIRTKRTNYEVEIFKGNMIDPYSHFKISNKGNTKYYSVKRTIQVDRVE